MTRADELRKQREAQLADRVRREKRALENLRRGAAAGTSCPHGHEYTQENTYVSPAGKRSCRACARRRYHEKKAA